MNVCVRCGNAAPFFIGSYNPVKLQSKTLYFCLECQTELNLIIERFAEGKD